MCEVGAKFGEQSLKGVFGWHVFYGVECGFERRLTNEKGLGLSPRSYIIGEEGYNSELGELALLLDGM